MVTKLIICGLSMEMEMAKECDGIGKCTWCLYYDTLPNGYSFCRCYDEVIDEKVENCPDWVVDHR